MQHRVSQVPWSIIIPQPRHQDQNAIIISHFRVILLHMWYIYQPKSRMDKWSKIKSSSDPTLRLTMLCFPADYQQPFWLLPTSTASSLIGCPFLLKTLVHNLGVQLNSAHFFKSQAPAHITLALMKAFFRYHLKVSLLKLSSHRQLSKT